MKSKNQANAKQAVVIQVSSKSLPIPLSPLLVLIRHFKVDGVLACVTIGY